MEQTPLSTQETLCTSPLCLNLTTMSPIKNTSVLCKTSISKRWLPYILVRAGIFIGTIRKTFCHHQLNTIKWSKIKLLVYLAWHREWSVSSQDRTRKPKQRSCSLLTWWVRLSRSWTTSLPLTRISIAEKEVPTVRTFKKANALWWSSTPTSMDGKGIDF